MSDFLENSPTTIIERVKRDAPDHEDVLIRVVADLDEGLRFAPHWLVVTNRRVLLINQGDGSGTEIPLHQIRSATVEALVGGGRLVLRHGDAALGVAYFTNSA